MKLNDRSIFAFLVCAVSLSYAQTLSTPTKITDTAKVGSSAADLDFATLQVASRPLEVTSISDSMQAQKLQSSAFVAAANQAQAFYTRYPKDSRASSARRIQVISLLRAANTGTIELEPQALRLARDYRSDTANASHDRYQVAMTVLQREILRKTIKDQAQLMQEYHDRALDLYGEFPNEPAVFELFLGVARNAEPVLGRSTADAILRMPAPDSIKSEAQAVIDRLDMPGKPVAFEWQDESGKSFSVANFKGKILIFYVWASWAHNSIDGFSLVAAAKGPGIEVISVDVDTDPQKGRQAMSKTDIGAIVYSDGRGMKGPLPQQLRAYRVPGVHVVDAKGTYVGTGSPADLGGLLTKASAKQ
jgi:hypothetical protein